MSAINDLIQQIDNPELRNRLESEIARITKQKKFGLVFEEHLPECTQLFDVPVKRGSTVSLKSGKVNELYTVKRIDGDSACCIKLSSKEEITVPLSDLVTTASFGDPIYPFLKPIDSVCNAPDSSLWHTLIEADNYHALQLLEYLYAGKVDCIYIDPPYNTGAKDWKYNNDYVDSSDSYRHSKWLSMMQKRLKIAKRLLNPNNSVLIVTIDEKEYIHLGCLLEDLFPEATIQMISSVINRAGTGRKYEFSRTDEYIYFLRFGESKVAMMKENLVGKPVTWDTLRRSAPTNTRDKTKTQFYPIFVDNQTKRIHSVGQPLGKDVNINTIKAPIGCTAVFPIRDTGLEMMWGCVRDEFISRLENGFIRVGKYTPNKPQKYVISYLTEGIISDINCGNVEVRGYNKDGSVDAFYVGSKEIPPTTNWQNPLHDAQWYGTNILKPFLGGKSKFQYPKSIYAIKDCLSFFLNDKPNALIIDFFAGSGTTLHAVNLLNAEDGGNRRCILVTNNEVSDEESKSLTAQGFKPGDEEWEKLGIARSVTWPRTVCSIEGHDVNGEPLKGNYIGSDIPMSDGFKANAAFFKLGFLDKTSVALGRQFKELLPILWMKAGCIGPCPSLGSKKIPDMLILPENKFAVLIDDTHFGKFETELENHSDIETIYLVTDSDAGYREMIIGLENKNTYQLYRDYLDNFRINIAR